MESYITTESKFRAALDKCVFGLAAVLVATIMATASILITLPEALEAVATPAFGAPWITAPAPGNIRTTVQAAIIACAK